MYAVQNDTKMKFNIVLYMVTGQPANKPTRRQTNSPRDQLADNQICQQPTRRQSNSPINQLAENEIVTEIYIRLCTRMCLSGKLAEEIWCIT